MQVYQLYFCNRGGAAWDASSRAAVFATIGEAFESFTAWEAEGFFRGAPQPTLCVMIASAEGEPVLALARRLRADLDQEAIGLVEGGDYGRITG